MLRINFLCDRCKGPVWSDIISAKHIDMSCLYCGKRYFVKRHIYDALVKRLEKKHASKVTRNRELLQKQRASI